MQILKIVSSSDGSKKYLFGLEDKNCIEATLIPQPDGANFCISCQVGCMNRCKHCATGRLDFERDLTVTEIIAEVHLMLQDLKIDKGKFKILFMGMGEPFLNYDNVMNAVNILGTEPWLDGLHNVIVSTSGVLPAINQLSKEALRPRLAITIGATSDDKRGRLLIPTGKLYPLSLLLETCREYVKSTGDSLIFQYPLIEGFNNSVDEAKALVSLVRDIPCDIHIIPFNEFEESEFKRPSQESISAFHNAIDSSGISVSIKPSFGTDVYGGCGQLALKS